MGKKPQGGCQTPPPPGQDRVKSFQSMLIQSQDNLIASWSNHSTKLVERHLMEIRSCYKIVNNFLTEVNPSIQSNSHAVFQSVLPFLSIFSQDPSASSCVSYKIQIWVEVIMSFQVSFLFVVRLWICILHWP